MKNSFEDRDLYCFWFGSSMSESRANCLDTILKNANVNVIIVNDENVREFEIKSDPFHIGFDLLSDTDKSNYLRPYFMYHYGGGYTDIKQNYFDWNPYFTKLEQSGKDCIGYREKQSYHVHYEPAQKIYKKLIGCGSYIHKKGSFLSEQWLTLENKEMDFYYEKLKENHGRYHPRAIFGGILDNKTDFAGSQYPFRWNHLCSEVWHRAQFENLGRWSFDFPYINTENYR